MESNEFLERLVQQTIPFVTKGYQVVDKDGNPIEQIVFDHQEGKIILK